MSTVITRRASTIVAALLIALATPRTAVAEEEHCHPATSPTNAATPGSTPRAPMAYTVPDVRLVRSDGTEIQIQRELDSGRPVVLNFIFTTCTAICPVMTQTLAKVQQRLGDDRDRVMMVSISIDPERDTPARLAAYARKFGAGPQWSFYTGTAEASVALQKAFDTFRGNKMNHVPVTFVRVAPDRPWIRLEGLGNAEAIVREVKPALALSDRRRP